MPRCRSWYALGLLFFAALVSPRAWTVDSNLYRTEELPRLVQDAKAKAAKLEQEQQARRQEISQLDQQIPRYVQRIGNNPRKNPDAVKALEDAKYRKQILEQKLAYYAPRLKEEITNSKTFEALYRARQAELAQLPKGSPAVWTTAQLKAAAPIYNRLSQRAHLQVKYYTRAYGDSVATINESNRRQDFLLALENEARNYDRILGAIQNRLNQRQAEADAEKAAMAAQEREAEENARLAEAKARIATPPPAPVTPAPSPTVPPTPQPTPTPEPKDFITVFSGFIEQHLIWVLAAVWLASGTGVFVAMQIFDRDNARHTPWAALIFATAVTVAAPIPVFGWFLGFVGLVLAYWFYYQLDMDKFSRVMPVSVGIFAGTWALLLAVFWLMVG